MSKQWASHQQAMSLARGLLFLFKDEFESAEAADGKAALIVSTSTHIFLLLWHPVQLPLCMTL
ncbi:hypothetical protein BSK49_13450 [Paenibacillus odorifer]|uniref:hypothetical protein n=2 Tax=Paenibacillus TaxID=44249 RepID=UPI00096DB832|nr:hypothetical protein [Paenibacillus odorifer]OMD88910.1 hypothetical protein BSK49_13450 [Paenibacillus odorifer]